MQREIAEFSGTSAASVSSLIDGLGKLGYVERRPSAGDARRKELHVLPPARGITEGFDQAMQQAENDLLAPLSTAEQETLVHLLVRL